jgi:hypothetical protein
MINILEEKCYIIVTLCSFYYPFGERLIIRRFLHLGEEFIMKLPTASGGVSSGIPP